MGWQGAQEGTASNAELKGWSAKWVGEGYGEIGQKFSVPGMEWELFEESEAPPEWLARDMHRWKESALVRAK